MFTTEKERIYITTNRILRKINCCAVGIAVTSGFVETCKEKKEEEDYYRT